MKTSLADYTVNHFNHINSISGSIAEIPMTESEFIKKNGKFIDSVFYKMHSYNQILFSSNINESIKESYNIYFNINEQQTLKEYFILLTENLIKSYEYDLQVNEGILNDISNKIKDTGTNIVNAVKNIPDTLKALKEFIIKVKNNAIKSMKDICYTVVDLMLKCGNKLADIMQKMQMNANEGYSVLFSKVKEAFKKKECRENIYESLSDSITGNEVFINEFSLWPFGKNKNNADQNSDNQNNTAGGKDDSYIKAQNAVNGTLSDTAADNAVSSKKGIGIGKAIGYILLQMVAYAVVCIVMPAIVGLIAGPVAGAVSEILAKIIWSSTVIWLQLRKELQLHKSGEFDRKYPTKLTKTIHYIFLFATIAFAGWKLISGIIDGAGLIKNLCENNPVLPSEAVQKTMEALNSLYKAVTGSNTPGFDQLEATREKIEAGITNVDYKEVDKQAVGSEKNITDDINKQNFHGSSTEMINYMKSHAGTYDTGDRSVFAIDGKLAGRFRSGELNSVLQKMGIDPKDVKIDSIINNDLYNSTHHNAGISFMLSMDKMSAEQAAELQQAFIDNSPKLNTIISLTNYDLGKEVINKVTHTAINAFIPSSDIFGGFVMTDEIFKQKGYFNIRMGSKASLSKNIYAIEDVKSMTWQKAYDNYISKYNPNAAGILSSYINGTNKVIDAAIQETEKNSTPENKKANEIAVDVKNQREKLMRSKDTCIIFFGKKIVMPKKKRKSKAQQVQEQPQQNESYQDYLRNYIFEAEDQNTNDTQQNNNDQSQQDNQNQDKKDELVPVVCFNGLFMKGIDLVGANTRGKLRTPWDLKGLYTHIEILPREDGMNTNDIMTYLKNVLLNSFKCCYIMSYPKPYNKNGKKYELDPKADNDKQQLYFGDFTNKELLDIVQTQNILKYLGGQFGTDTTGLKHNFVEKTAANRENNEQQMMTLMSNDDKIKNYINKSDSLKKLMTDDNTVNKEELDKVFDFLFRVEQTYKKNSENKLSLFGKMKNFIKRHFFKQNPDTGNSEQSNDSPLKNYNIKEIQNLAFMLADRMVNGRKKSNNNDQNQNNQPQDTPAAESYDSFVNNAENYFNPVFEQFFDQFVDYYYKGIKPIEENYIDILGNKKCEF